MRIGLDFDGVIVDNTTMKADRIAQRYGISLPPSAFHRSAVMSGRTPGLSPRQYFDAKRDVYIHKQFAEQMVPVAGAKEYIRRLMQAGHTVVIVSSRSRRSARFARKWCRGLGQSLVVVGVGMDKVDKSEAARHYRLDVFVDNELVKLRALNGTVKHKFLFTWHNNLHDNVEGIAVRVIGWSDLYEKLRRLEPSFPKAKTAT